MLQNLLREALLEIQRVLQNKLPKVCMWLWHSHLQLHVIGMFLQVSLLLTTSLLLVAVAARHALVVVAAPVVFLLRTTEV